jgi:hypothetical protein
MTMRLKLSTRYLLVATLVLLPAAAVAQLKSNGQLLIDISGSMDKNDSERLRWDAMLTLTQLLGLSHENGLTVRYFSGRDSLKIPHTRITPESQRRIERLAGERPPDRGRTDVVPSLAAAVSELSSHAGVRYIVLVTDGIFAGEREIEWLTRKLRAFQGRVYLVCIAPGGLRGPRVNTVIVGACEFTGGKAYGIDTRKDIDRSEILSVFLDIFAQISPPSIVLLTNSEGGFSLNRSNRSFIALSQQGRRLKVVAPGGAPVGNQEEPFRAREISFRKWNVVICERPELDLIAEHWESNRWMVVDEVTGERVPDAHIYIHSDVALKGVGPSGFAVTERHNPLLEVSLSASALDRWVGPIGEDELLDQAAVDVEVYSGHDALDIGVASGRLTHRGDGKFVGELRGRLEQGDYLLSMVARHGDYQAGRLVQVLRVPLVVRPPYYEQRVLFSRGGGVPEQLLPPQPGDVPADLFVGDRIQYQIDIHLQKQLEGRRAAPQSVSMRTIELALVDPAQQQETRRPMKLGERQGDRLIYVSDWIPLEAPGVYHGQVHLEAVLRILEPGLLPGQPGEAAKKAAREELFSDTFKILDVECKQTALAVEWDVPPAVFGADEALYWAGRIRALRGPPDKTPELLAAIARHGVSVRIEGESEGEEYHSLAQAHHFLNLRSALVGQRVEFSGQFIGLKSPGRYTLNALIHQDGEERAPATGNPLLVDVGQNLIEVLVTGKQGNRVTRLPARGGEGGMREVAAFENHALGLEIKSTGFLRARADDVFSPPAIELASIGSIQQLEPEGSGSYFTVPRFSPGLGEHQLTIQTRVGARSVVRHVIILKVQRMAVPEVAWELPIEPQYLQFEVAPLVARIDFPESEAPEPALWEQDNRVVASLGRALASGMVQEIELERDPSRPEILAYKFLLPTAEPGRYEIALHVMQDGRRASKPLQTALEVVPALEFRVEQQGKPLMSSRDRTVREAINYHPVRMRVAQSERTRAPLEAARVVLRRLAQPKEGKGAGDLMFDLKRLSDGSFRLDETLDPGLYAFRFEAELLREGGRTRVAWSSPPVNVIHASPWPKRVAFGLLGLGGVLVLLTGLLFRRDPDLPLLEGRATWFYPRYESTDFVVTTSFIQRLTALGKRRRKLRIGSRGLLSFGVLPQEVGLARSAHIDLEVVEEKAKNGEKSKRLLVLRGHNVGGRTPLEVNGHIKARVLGQEEVRVDLESMTSAQLQLQAGKMCMHVRLDLVPSRETLERTAKGDQESRPKIAGEQSDGKDRRQHNG